MKIMIKMNDEDREKAKRLWEDLLDWYEEEEIQNTVVAFSGGKDSTLILDSAMNAVEELKAIIFDSEIYADWETRAAVEKAEDMGVDFEVREVKKLKDENFSSNPEDRCYYCKKQLFDELIDERGVILEGTNASEIKGHRPGFEAVKEHAKTPLVEVGLEDEDVRNILKWRGHDVWDRPSFACLASRFPTGRELTEERLRKIERVEEKIFDLGIDQLRVRDFGDEARIEVWEKDMEKILKNREKVINWLKDEGYERILLDLEGYRTGSISE